MCPAGLEGRSGSGRARDNDPTARFEVEAIERRVVRELDDDE
jgi:hypothetical protein